MRAGAHAWAAGRPQAATSTMAKHRRDERRFIVDPSLASRKPPQANKEALRIVFKVPR